VLAHQFIQVVDRDFLRILGVHEDGDRIGHASCTSHWSARPAATMFFAM
jgi:hypothetical protein